MFSVIKLSDGIPAQYNLTNSANDCCHLYQHKTKLDKFIGTVRVPALFGNESFYFLLTGITQEYVEDSLSPPEGFSLEEFDLFEDICYKRILLLSLYNSEELKKVEPELYLLNKTTLASPFWVYAFLGATKEKDDIQPGLYAISQLVYATFAEKVFKIKSKG